jgi:hypothetical protein
MDYNTQFQVPQPPQPMSKGKVIGIIILGIIFIAACAYVLWAMYGNPEVATEQTQNTEQLSTQNQQPTTQTQPQAKSDEVDDLDQEAAAFNSADLDSSFESGVNSEL